VQNLDERNVLPHDFGDVFFVRVSLALGVEDACHRFGDLGGRVSHVDVHTSLIVGDDVAEVLVLLVLHAAGRQEPVDQFLQFPALLLRAAGGLGVEVAFEQHHNVQQGFLAVFDRLLGGLLVCFQPL